MEYEQNQLTSASVNQLNSRHPAESSSILERMDDYEHAVLTFEIYWHHGETTFGVEDVLSWLQQDDELSDGLQQLQSASPSGVLNSESIKSWLDLYVGFRWGNQTLVRTDYDPPRWKVLNERRCVPADEIERALHEFTHGFYAAFGNKRLTTGQVYDCVMDGKAGVFGDYLWKELQMLTKCVFNMGILSGWLEQCKGLPHQGKILIGSNIETIGWQVLDFPAD